MRAITVPPKHSQFLGSDLEELRKIQPKALDIYSVISQPRPYKAAAIIIMKTIIEPNRVAASFMKAAGVILDIFVAL